MRKFLIILMGASLIAGSAHSTGHKPHELDHHQRGSEFRPYDAERDAAADVDAALARAAQNGTKALIIMGANWCHDSRGLTERFARSEFRALIEQNYELVYVSVGTKPGQNNQNRAISKRFGVKAIEGTPTVFIVSSDGQVLNGDSAGYWRTADTIPADMSYAYFEHYAKK